MAEGSECHMCVSNGVGDLARRLILANPSLSLQKMQTKPNRKQ